MLLNIDLFAIFVISSNSASLDILYFATLLFSVVVNRGPNWQLLGPPVVLLPFLQVVALIETFHCFASIPFPSLSSKGPLSALAYQFDYFLLWRSKLFVATDDTSLHCPLHWFLIWQVSKAKFLLVLGDSTHGEYCNITMTMMMMMTMIVLMTCYNVMMTTTMISYPCCDWSDLLQVGVWVVSHPWPFLVVVMMMRRVFMIVMRMKILPMWL